MARLTDVTSVRRAVKPVGQLDHGRSVEATEIRNRRFCREVEVRGLFPPRKQQGAAWTGLAVGIVCLALELIIHADMGRAASWENCPNPSTGPDTCLTTGKVGIGTTGPSYKVDIPTDGDLLRVDDAVIGSSGIQGGFANWAVFTTPGRTSYQNHGISIDNGGGGGLNVYNVPSTGDHRFRVDNGEALILKGSNRYLGLGTSNPAMPFQMHNASASQMYISSATPAVWLGNHESFGTASHLGVFGMATNPGNFVADTAIGDVVLTSGATRDILFGTGGTQSGPATTRMIIKNGGNVGLGTLTPTTKLHVVGDVTVTGNIAAKYQDVAEWVPAPRALEPGTVVVLDHEHTNQVLPATHAYDTKVAGVISAQPGLLLGEGGDDKVKVATTGRAKVKADARHRPIQTGDLLVTGEQPATAIASEPIELNGRWFHQPGTILGKALEPLSEGQGEILVLLTLQ